LNKNRIEYFVLLIISKLFNFLGLKRSRKFAKYLSYFFYYFVPIRKSTILGNLKIAFPEWDEKKTRGIAIKNYESLLIMLIEFLVIPNFSSDEFEQSTYCNNLNIVEEELAKDKGIMLLTGHFGNWELSVMWLSMQISQPINILVKAQRNPYVTELLNKNRGAFGNRVVMLGTSVKELFKRLKENEIIGIAIDQRGPKESRRVKLFGKDTAVYAGTATIALKTGSQIIFMLMCRQSNYQYKLEFEKIEMPSGNETTEDKAFRINQLYMDKLEKYIRLYPEQWFWMHKIWKY